jgi:hypothetical protein
MNEVSMVTDPVATGKREAVPVTTGSGEDYTDRTVQ